MAKWEVVCDDVLHWAESYSGPKFHAILTDPPYELSFMGKHWDGSGVSFQPETWAALSAHLLPGAHLLAFGGSRTHHRLMCAIEDAGLEIRDCIYWAFGCLSEDTEILTMNGWERYHKDIANNPVLCYNVDKDSFEFHKPSRSFVYANQYPAYSIKSDSTDQIVSRNHRVLVERGGRKVFIRAEALEQQESVPILESLSDLPETIPDFQSVSSVSKFDLLARVRSSKNQGTKAAIPQAIREIGQADREVCGLRQRVYSLLIGYQESTAAGLLKALQRYLTRRSMEGTRSQGAGGMVARNHSQLSGKDNRPWKSVLAGWRHLLSQAWQLCNGQVRALSCGVLGNGPQGWLCYGTSAADGSVFGQGATAHRGSTPYQSRPDRQPAGKPDVVSDKRGTSAVRGTVATVTPIEYKGLVWCVSVPTGAFVARRNGHIFITGNSGFPKSLNVGKAIDKAAGAEREVVGSYARPDGSNPRTAKQGYQADYVMGNSETCKMTGESNITAPATPAAATWEGYGSALKPAVEVIVVARKPVEGTIAANCERYGSGALNIEQCRVGTEQIPLSNHNKTIGGNGKYNGGVAMQTGGGAGRWPANLILDDSEAVAGLFPSADAHIVKTRTACKGGIFGGGQNTDSNRYEDMGSAARFFYQAAWELDQAEQLDAADVLRYCAKASRAERDAGLDGFEVGRGFDKNTSVKIRRSNPDTGVVKEFEYHPSQRHNGHPTVKPLSLCRYLATLLLPPAAYASRRICVPFGGVASEAIGAGLAGWDEIVMVESEREYCDIAEVRLAYWLRQPELALR